MKNIKYILGLFLTIAFFVSCEESTYEFGDIVTPSNVQITAEIVGQDLSDPELLNGDGDGFVNFEVSADNVISYKIDFGDGKSEVVPSGKYKHRYTKVGTNKFTVIVSALGTAGASSTASMEVEVFSSFSDVEAENLLAGSLIGDSKTWYWASDIDLHVGLGPVSGDGYDWPAWWNAIKAWDEEKSCMYTNEFVFTRTADGITFEQTVGPAFVPGTYSGELGVDGDTCHDETVATTMFGVKNVSFLPSSSEAASSGTFEELPYRKSAFEISDGGFMGWYVGASTYDIISISENALVVRIEQSQGGDFAWYHKFTSTKPVQ